MITSPLVRLLRRILWVSSICVALLQGNACLATPVVEIELRTSVQVGHVQVTLGDVAELRGGDAGILASLRMMSLGAVPRSGAVSLSRSQIDRWIRSRAGSSQPALQWSGASAVDVSALQQTVAALQITQTAKDALQAWLAGRVERSEVNEVVDTRDIMVAPGKLRLNARMPTDEIPRKRMLIWVDVWVDDAFVRAVPVSFVVRAYQTAYIARQDVRVGRVVQDTEFDSRQIDVAESAAPVAVLKDTGAWRMKHTVARGGVLLKKQVEEAPAVARGETATLRSQLGVLTVESKVEVLQDGYPGQMIKVKLSAASGPVMARVASAGLLEMTEK